VRSIESVIADLLELRRADPPTHGGRVLSYVYDHGRADLDALVASAVEAFLPVNGLDPTTFTSVARLERDLVAFGRSITGGGTEVVGSVTSGGTESCLLAVKVARDLWQREHHTTPFMVMATTGHAAFRKAAGYLGVRVVEVSVSPVTGLPAAGAVLDAVRTHDPALVVLSAPSYPYGVMDPIADVAPVCADLGVPVHVDACIGGFLLPFLDAPPPTGWDFSVPGVMSISLDLHKYGYAPKGASLLLHRGRDRHLAQYFASTAWPGYPVVNPTALGSKSATALAAAWAVTQALGVEGYRELTADIVEASRALRTVIDSIDGLRIVGSPVPGLLALASDGERGVDPFQLVDDMRGRGFVLQAQPGMVQPDGTRLPRTAHLTLTPVSRSVVDELGKALVAAASALRGQVAPRPDLSLVAAVAANGLPHAMAPVLATLEALPRAVAEPALAGILQAVVDPDRSLAD
jgi:glutamate/tyrosine decarboxylase-like PLP-dependent enzyme